MVVERIRTFRKGFSDLFSTDQVSLVEIPSDTTEVIYPLTGEGKDIIELECQEFVSGKKELTPENFLDFVKGMMSLIGGNKYESGYSVSNYLDSPNGIVMNFRYKPDPDSKMMRIGNSGPMAYGQVEFKVPSHFIHYGDTIIPVYWIEETITFPLRHHKDGKIDAFYNAAITRSVHEDHDWQPPTFISVLDGSEIPLINLEDYGYFERKDTTYEQALQVCAKAFEIYKKART